MLPNPKININDSIGTIISTFEDLMQMELMKVRLEEIKNLSSPSILTST